MKRSSENIMACLTWKKRTSAFVLTNIQNDHQERNADGATLVCFLKKLLKCAGSSKPKQYAISDTFQLVWRNNAFASPTSLSAICSVVVLPVVSLIARFK